MEEIKDRIKKALSIRNMKQIELSEKTGISKFSISQYLSGYAKPKQDRIYLMAKALDVKEAWLLGYDVPMEKEDIKSNAILHATVSNDNELAEAIKKYYEMSEEDRKDIIEFINFKYSKGR